MSGNRIGTNKQFNVLKSMALRNSLFINFETYFNRPGILIKLIDGKILSFSQYFCDIVVEFNGAHISADLLLMYIVTIRVVRKAALYKT